MSTLPDNMGALSAYTPPPADVSAIPQGILPYLQHLQDLTPYGTGTPAHAAVSAIPEGLQPYLQSLFHGVNS